MSHQQFAQPRAQQRGRKQQPESKKPGGGSPKKVVSSPPLPQSDSSTRQQRSGTVTKESQDEGGDLVEPKQPGVDQKTVEVLATELDWWLWPAAMKDAREKKSEVSRLQAVVKNKKAIVDNSGNLRPKDRKPHETALNNARAELKRAQESAAPAEKKRKEFAARTRSLLDAAQQAGVHVRFNRRVLSFGGGAWQDPTGPAEGGETADRGRSRWLRQVSQERGDMHDIRAAMHVLAKKFPEEQPQQLRVVVVMLKDPGQLDDIKTIISYYQGFGQQVLLELGGPRIDDEKILKASRSTTILQNAAKQGDITAHLQDATAVPIENPKVAAAYETLLKQQFHFDVADPGKRYALINYRVSGHGAMQGRVASHPELDTGTQGFVQLWKAAEKRGFVPVPTGGDIPAKLLTEKLEFKGDEHPTLIDYFRHTADVVKAGADAGLTMPKRMYEYGIFRYIAKHFPRSVAIGMRSGGLDAIAFSGIPAISIDIHEDTVQAGIDSGSDKVGPLEKAFTGELVNNEIKGRQYGHPGSFTRAAKRKDILPGGRFQQVFMNELRYGSGTTSTSANPKDDPRELRGHWMGELDEGSVGAVDEALTAEWDRHQDLLQEGRVSQPLSGGIQNLAPAKDVEADVDEGPELVKSEVPLTGKGLRKKRTKQKQTVGQQ